MLVAWTISETASQSLKGIPTVSDLSFFNWSIFTFLIIGGSLVYAGGCTLNDAFDKKYDEKYNPLRPIPKGSIKLNEVWILGITELVIGSTSLILGAGCSPIWVCALVFAVIIYDIVHKKWIGGIFVMGSCRLFLWLSAATASGSTDISPQTWIWGIVLTSYIVGISFFARGEAKGEKSTNHYSILLLFGSPMIALAALIYWNQLDPVRVFLANIVGLLTGWIAFSSVLIVKQHKKGSIGIGVSRLLAGICAVDATAVCFYSPILTAPSLCCLSLAVLLQKKFAAT